MGKGRRCFSPFRLHYRACQQTRVPRGRLAVSRDEPADAVKQSSIRSMQPAEDEAHLRGSTLLLSVHLHQQQHTPEGIESEGCWNRQRTDVHVRVHTNTLAIHEQWQLILIGRLNSQFNFLISPDFLQLWRNAMIHQSQEGVEKSCW